MARRHSGRAVKGSRFHLQCLVNGDPRIDLNNFILARSQSLSDYANGQFEWKSPLKSQGYIEYRDAAFLTQVGLPQLGECLSSFWPRLGPCWDALATVPGKDDGHGVILVEAKSHVTELGTNSSVCGAKAKSLNLIKASLEISKKALGVEKETDWLGKYYQYANRLAHLYWLNSQQIPVWMVFLYFMGDINQRGPEAELDWRKHLTLMKTELGLLENHILSDRIVEVFIPLEHRDIHM